MCWDLNSVYTVYNKLKFSKEIQWTMRKAAERACSVNTGHTKSLKQSLRNKLKIRPGKKLDTLANTAYTD